MIRATTPTHFFELPIEYASNIDKMLVTYSQRGKPVLNKTEKDATFEGTAVYYTLTQDETNLFQADTFVELQIRVKTKDGKAVASDTYSMPVKKVLNDEVL